MKYDMVLFRNGIIAESEHMWFLYIFGKHAKTQNIINI